MEASQIFILPGAEITTVTKTDYGFQIQASTSACSGSCPDCKVASSQIHSWYERHPYDLPVQGIRVRLHLQVKRFFCPNEHCERKTFVEALPELVLKYARRTTRFTEHLKEIAFAVGAEGGKRLGASLGIERSPDTLLRIIGQTSLPIQPTPRVLGVDDWAFRKGKRYGTVLCDLERHRVIEILPDREAETLMQWLIDHPGVEVISRDRGTAYIEGATAGAPHAQQVADRWHLLKNLREVVQTVLEQYRSALTIKAPFSSTVSLPEQESLPTHATSNLSKRAEASLLSRQRRYERYQQVMHLYSKGLATQTISHLVGISEETVKRYTEADEFPEIKRYQTVSSRALAPYEEYLKQRWLEGCHNATQLWREIKAQGFTRSLPMVQKYIAQLRGETGIAYSSEAPMQCVATRRYTPQQVAWFIVSDKDALQEQEYEDLLHFRQQSPAIEQAYRLAKAFITIFRERQVEKFAGWLQQALEASDIWQSFAVGLHRDRAAILASLALEWSNGQVEGQVNRIKAIKRQMYGRAGFPLLRKRILYRPS